MNERGMEFKVGLLVLAALGLLVAFVLTLGDFRATEGLIVTADFSSSADLKSGAQVKITGVTVGKVREVQFWGGRRDNKGKSVQVRVLLEIDEAKARTLRQDARAYITTLGILGQKYVEVEPGTVEAPAWKQGDVLTGVPPLRLELVARDLALTLSEVSSFLRENRGTLAAILHNTNETVKHADAVILDNRDHITSALQGLSANVEQLERILTSAEIALGDGSDVRQTLENARRITGKVNSSVSGIVGRIRQTLEAFERVADTYIHLGEDGRKRLLTALDEVDAILADAHTVSGNIRDGRGAVGALLADQELYDDLKELLEDLRRHPWKFIWKE